VVAIIGIAVGGLLAVLAVVAVVSRLTRQGKDGRRYREPSFEEPAFADTTYLRGANDPFKQSLDQYHVVGGPMANAPKTDYYRGY